MDYNGKILHLFTEIQATLFQEIIKIPLAKTARLK